MDRTQPPTKPYVRKSPRIAFAANVVVTVAEGLTFVGRFIDLSSGGACIELPYRASPGEAVRLFLERRGQERGVWAGASVIGQVAWAIAVAPPIEEVDGGVDDEGDPVECDGFDFEVEGTGTEARTSSWHRLGIALRPSAVTERWLSELQAPAEYTVEQEPAMRRLGRGRDALDVEAIHRAALGLLASGDVDGAREVVRAALCVLPRSSELRGLQMRIDAEQALSSGDLDIAERRIANGRRFAGLEPCWSALEERLFRARSRGFLGRLRGLLSAGG